MIVKFDIKNFVNYINNLFSELDNYSYPMLDYILQQQDVYINYTNPSAHGDMCISKCHLNSVVIDEDYFFLEATNNEGLNMFYIELERVLGDGFILFKHKFETWLKMRSSSKGVYWKGEEKNTDSRNMLKAKFDTLGKISFWDNNHHIDNKTVDSYMEGDHEISSLQSIFCIDGKYYPMKTYYTQELKDWTCIKRNSVRSSDIIIVDPFLFSTNIERFEVNVFSLIEALCCNYVKETNVVIFANYDERIDIVLAAIRNTSVWESIKKRIHADEISITFVCPAKKKHDRYKMERSLSDLLHDRYIITNHRLIVSGHSFAQYFTLDKDNDLNFTARGSMWMNINSFADENNENVAISAIEYLQKNIISRCDKNDIFGDCKSNLFTFNKKTHENNQEHIQHIKSKEGYKQLKKVVEDNYEYRYVESHGNESLFYIKNANDRSQVQIDKDSIYIYSPKGKSDNYLFGAKKVISNRNRYR